MTVRAGTGLVAFAAALLIAALAVVVLIGAYSYSRASGLFPIFAGWIFVALTALEIVVQGRALLRGEAMYSPPSTAEGLSQAFFGGLRETGGFLWLGLLVALTALVGFLVAIPVFMMAFLRISAGRKLLQSALFALVGTAIVYCVFVWILDYRLYPGALFGG